MRRSGTLSGGPLRSLACGASATSEPTGRVGGFWPCSALRRSFSMARSTSVTRSPGSGGLQGDAQTGATEDHGDQEGEHQAAEAGRVAVHRAALFDVDAPGE